MAAKMMVRKWCITDTVNGEIEVRVVDDGNSDGPRAEIEQGDSVVWAALDDIEALVEALKAATTALRVM